ncbi:hypothetical protein PV10_07678 [Exophiala mesophila]|uniref:Zn(2)-C6 fungal-type domain-containing protein n=1 Tax=Exophiala mesophila TaxID=212818 RepID=A0A0D1Z693_EXOME|nr:uncharacterized protein PV10_07678 [Exophiala mesophila]KIV90367.1 hypothetical protein PV10_07678 [Exophiala mesophila]
MGAKRRRLALSCVACRRRKVRCDRTFPTCVRCQKGEVACDYVPYTGVTKSTDTLPTPSDASQSRPREQSVSSWTDEATAWHAQSKDAAQQTPAPVQQTGAVIAPSAARSPAQSALQLQKRIEWLENCVRSSPTGRLPPAHLTSEPDFPRLARTSLPVAFSPDQKPILFRGKGLKTKYYGPSHAANILSHSDQLSNFAKEVLTRVPALEKSRAVWKKKRHSQNHHPTLPDLAALLRLVPEPTRCDALVQEYFSNFETTYRVLHSPTFFQRYKEFWKSPESTSPSFLVQLLLVCACVNSVVPGGPSGFIGRSSAAHHAAVEWIDICGLWHEQQSHKHVTLDNFQVWVLLLIAKRLNRVKVKREWTLAGQVLRSAMAAGLHREPSFQRASISVFDQEMRRRLWYTIVEVELQASLDRGLCPGVQPYEWDCLPPINIHDEDLDPDMQELPAPRELTDPTRTSFLYLAQQTLPLRIEILTRINSVRFGLDIEMALDYDQRLREALQRLPLWKDKSSAVVAQDLSKLILYEYIMLIHQGFDRHSNDTPARNFYSHAARQDAALTTLKMYVRMPLNRALAFCNFSEVLFRACLAASHCVCISHSSHTSLNLDPEKALELTMEGLGVLESRIGRLGQGFYEFWIGSSAAGLARKVLPESPSTEVLAQQTADRIARLHENLMLGQVIQLTPESMVDTPETSSKPDHSMPPPRMNMNPEPPVPDLEAFMAQQTFNPFSETLFDFDVVDFWNTDYSAQI